MNVPMADDFDKFVDELQEQINEQARKDYSPNVLDLIARKPNNGTMSDANARGSSHDDANHSLTFFLLINTEHIIEKATYITNGCQPAFACGSQVTFLIRGKSVEQAKNVDVSSIAKALGKMPKEYHGYIDLSARALTAALNSYKDNQAARIKKR